MSFKTTDEVRQWIEDDTALRLCVKQIAESFGDQTRYYGLEDDYKDTEITELITEELHSRILDSIADCLYDQRNLADHMVGDEQHILDNDDW
jgi:hypothetical protein